MDEIETGNFNEEPSQRGWRVGHFIKDRPGFNTDLTELQWRFDIKAGSTKSAPAYNKQAATLTILVEGEMTIIFPHENRSIVLKEEGDYAFFAPGVCIRGRYPKTLRWWACAGHPSKTTRSNVITKRVYTKK